MISVPERARSLFKKAYIVAVIIAIAWALSGSGMDLAKAMDSLLVPQSAVYFLAWILMVALLGLLWKAWLSHAEGVSLQAAEWIPVQAMAWAGRYLPGKIGLLMGKLALVQRHRIDMRALVLSVFVEQAGFVLAGACVALLLFSPEELGAWQWLPPEFAKAWYWWMPVAVLVVGAAMPVMAAITARTLRCSRVASKSMQAAIFLVLHAIPHLAIGVAFYVLVIGLFPQAASFPATHFVAVLALAHVAGVLAVFAPAGFGVREVVLAQGLRGVLSFEEALLLAAVLRVLTLLADGTILLAVAVAWRKWRRGAT
jgi:hypothetical protein